MEGDRVGVRRDDFRPHPGPLCDYCSYQAYCPAFGGSGTGAELTWERHRAALPFTPRVTARRWPPRGGSRIPRSSRGPGVRRGRRDQFLESIRNPILDRCMYTLSSGGHSLLWFGIGRAAGQRRGDLKFAASSGSP
jgi:hypothetical protein